MRGWFAALLVIGLVGPSELAGREWPATWGAMRSTAPASSALGTAIAIEARGPRQSDANQPRSDDERDLKGEAVGWFDLPVPGGAATLRDLGIPLEERALTLPLLARATHDRASRAGLSTARVTAIVAGVATPGAGSVEDSEALDIPAPLDAATWRELLALGRNDDLFSRFLTDRRALLVALGLMGTEDSIRRLAARDLDFLRFLYRQAAGAFVVASRSLAIHQDRVVVPGGAESQTIWESLAGARVTQPASFLRALLTKDQGRLAWYFDTMAGLEDARLAVAWGAGAPAALRRDQAEALYAGFRDGDPQWRVEDQPFQRNFADAQALVMMSEVASGWFAGPALTAFWDLVFDSDNVRRDQAERQLLRESTPLSLAALARATLVTSLRDRRSRFEMFRLAQRVFPHPTAAALPDIAAALSSYTRFRALLLALERMGITAPERWAEVVVAARHVSDEADDRHEAVASFQATVALIGRVRHARSIDAATTDRLLHTLAQTVLADSRVIQSIGHWIGSTFAPALPPLERPDAWTGKTAYESTILQSLAGPPNRDTPLLEWEGLTYKVDVVAAEQARLRAVRLRIPSPGLDAAIERTDPEAVSAALTALVYATALGDADGAAALSSDVATRHDFGWGMTSTSRDVSPWAPPEERQGSGAWRVHGSLIGLDLGLARLALRRVADQQMPSAPKLTLNDFATLTRTIVSMVPADLTDADRDEIAAALARGRRRVANAGAQPAALDALAREVRMAASARQVLPWVASRQPEALSAFFSLRDLLWLGKPMLAQAELDRWGVSGGGLDGRHVAVMPPPAPWEDFAGRADAGQITTQLPDVTLRLVEETARMRVPAVLIPSMLAFAIEDYWHEVRARFADDLPSMTRQALALRSPRIEDYVAALTGNGPLRRQ